MKVLFNILMAIVVWYAPQFLAGAIVGFIALAMDLSMDTAIITATIVGLLVSIASEIIYWRYRAISKRKEA